MHIIDLGPNALIGLLAVCGTLCWLAWTGLEYGDRYRQHR